MPQESTITRTWTATDDCDNSNSCTQMITVLRKEVSLIIKQGACPAPVNASSHGVVPMVLVGDSDFNVSQVVVSSLQLSRCACEGGGGSVAPIDGPPGPKIKILDLNHPTDETVDCNGCACNADQSSDGIDDISMKYRTDDMVGVLSLSPGEGVVVLAVTGELDEPAYPPGPINVGFMARDCIVIVPPGGQGPINATVGSNVADTYIEIQPLDLNVDSDGFADFGRAYFPDTVVTVTAPKRSNGRRFLRWSVNGIMLEFGLRTLEMVVPQDVTLRAIYERPTSVEPDRPTEDDGDLE